MTTRITMDQVDLNSLPPLTFVDLWYALDVSKRTSLLDYMIQDDGVDALTLGSNLSCLNHYDSHLLVRLLVECSKVQFGRYVKLCSIDCCSAFDDQLVDKDAITVETSEHLPELEWIENIKPSLDAPSVVEPSDASTESALEQPEQATQDLDEEIVASTAPTLFEPADPKLRQLIHDLPVELLLQIRDDTFSLIFGPRYVYPHNERSNVAVFKALDRQLMAKYKPIFYGDNTWVVGQGDYDDGFGVLHEMPKSLRHSIRKVKLSFRTEDFDQHYLDSHFAPKEAWDTRNALKALRSYRDECANHVNILTLLWCSKFHEVTNLGLDSLILDFTDAYAPDATYLGVRLARELNSFCHACPREWYIYAPTQDLADEIWDVLMLIEGDGDI